MVDPHNPQSEPTPTDSSGFGGIARKLKRRTTDLLALAIISVGLLAVGAKISRWWKQSPDDAIPPQISSSQVVAWGEEGAGVHLEFGQLNHALFREVISGNADSAGQQLEEIVLGQLAKVSLASTPPSPSEQKLLKELEIAPVSRALPGDEALYRIGDDLPMVIVTKSVPDQGTEKTRHRTRVVCWARAFPQAENRWLVLLFHPVNGSSGSSVEECPLPLPPGSKRIQSLRDASGQSWIAFRGTGPILRWQRHFDQVLLDRNWNRLRPWSIADAGWNAGFHSMENSQRAEIWLTINAEGTCEGMILMESLRSKRREPE